MFASPEARWACVLSSSAIRQAANSSSQRTASSDPACFSGLRSSPRKSSCSRRSRPAPSTLATSKAIPPGVDFALKSTLTSDRPKAARSTPSSSFSPVQPSDLPATVTEANGAGASMRSLPVALSMSETLRPRASSVSLTASFSKINSPADGAFAPAFAPGVGSSRPAPQNALPESSTICVKTGFCSPPK